MTRGRTGRTLRLLTAPIAVALPTLAVAAPAAAAPPEAPAITSPLSGDSTPSTWLVVTGTGQEGATVTVTDGTTTWCTATVAPDGTWSCRPDAPPPDDQHTITARQQMGTEQSPESAAASFVVAANAPAITSPAGGAWRRSAMPTISGTGQPDTAIEVVEGRTTVCTATVTAAGAWACRADAEFADGRHAVAALQSDGNGVARSLTVSFGVDTSRPAAPTVLSPTAGSTEAWTTVHGLAEDGATVTVRDGADKVCTATVDPEGRWECAPEGAAPSGTHLISATQTDRAGNVSAASDAVRVEIASPTPASTGATAPAPIVAAPDDDGVPVRRFALLGVLALAAVSLFARFARSRQRPKPPGRHREHVRADEREPALSGRHRAI